MMYKDFQDLKLSALGMGAMRLPVIDGNDAAIDEVASAEMVAYMRYNTGSIISIPHGAITAAIRKS